MAPVYLITGGSRGIGAAVARLAAEQGASVCVNYVANGDAAQAVVDDIKSRGGQVMACQGDMAIEADIERVFDECSNAFGPVTVLVNNAGVLDLEGNLADFSSERISRIINLNVTGALLCAREAVRRMSTDSGGRGGSIINISSMAATLGSGGAYVDYAASKGAIDALTIGLAREVARQGIRVNGIRPGIIETDIHASGGNPTRAEDLADTVPMGRPGKPQEVAEAVIWLASDKASYITGSTINVSGGR